MEKPVAYEDIAEDLALYVYNVWYREEPRINLPPIKTFDNVCSSQFQIPAGVLTKLKINEPIDDIGRRSVFVCEPSDFKKRAIENKSQGCGFDTLVLAVICLAENDGPKEEGLLKCLIQLGLCKPVEFKTKTIRFPPVGLKADDFRFPIDRKEIEVPDFALEWTDKRAFYDELRRDWVSLIA